VVAVWVRVLRRAGDGGRRYALSPVRTDRNPGSIQKALNRPAGILRFTRSTVTGGAGLARTLQTQPHLRCSSSVSNETSHLSQHQDVVIIDNLATGRRENIEHLLDHPRVTLTEGSITGIDDVTILSSRLLHLFLWQRQPLSGIIEIFARISQEF
jgi:hypothetical protein